MTEPLTGLDEAERTRGTVMQADAHYLRGVARFVSEQGRTGVALRLRKIADWIEQDEAAVRADERTKVLAEAEALIDYWAHGQPDPHLVKRLRSLTEPSP